jgi:Na+/proline symporter
MFFLTTAPLWLAGLVLVGLTTLIAMMGPLVIRRRMSLDVLRTNNEVAGFKFATVGVIYAVLLGFTVIVVWEKFNDAENNVALEAGAALHNANTAYIQSVIDHPLSGTVKVDSEPLRWS